MNKEKLPLLLLVVIIFLQAAFTFSFSLTLFHELKTSAYDGALFAQLLYNVNASNGLVTSIAPPYVEQNWLGFHFSPILYLLAPIYALFPHVYTLLVIHNLLIALAALPLFFIARQLLKSPWQAYTIAIFYLLSPFVVNAQIWDFHEIAFAPLLLTGMLWAVLNKKRSWLIACCILLIATKEHYGLAVFGTGLLWAQHWREKRFGLGLAAFGLAAFFTVILVLMPHFNELQTATMLNSSLPEMDRFSWLLRPIDHYPLVFEAAMVAFFYCLMLLAPFWALPFMSAAWLLPGLADCAVNILSMNNGIMRHPTSYHTLPLIPILLVAFCMTLSKRYGNTGKLTRSDLLIASSVMTCAFGFSFYALPNLPANLWEFTTPKITYAVADAEALEDVKDLIGSTATVSAQNNVIPHLGVRRAMYHFPEQVGDAEFIVLNTDFPYQQKLHMFGSPYGSRKEDYFVATKKLMQNPAWNVVMYEHHWLVLAKNGDDNKKLRAQANQDFATSYTHYSAIKSAALKLTQPSHQP